MILMRILLLEPVLFLLVLLMTDMVHQDLKVKWPRASKDAPGLMGFFSITSNTFLH